MSSSGDDDDDSDSGGSFWMMIVTLDRLSIRILVKKAMHHMAHLPALVKFRIILR